MAQKAKEKPVKKNKDGFEVGKQLSHKDLMQLREQNAKKVDKAT